MSERNSSSSCCRFRRWQLWGFTSKMTLTETSYSSCLTCKLGSPGNKTKEAWASKGVRKTILSRCSPLFFLISYRLAEVSLQAVFSKLKVHIFWEGHTILQNPHRRFDYIGKIYGGGFAKFCGLLRIYELYTKGICFDFLQVLKACCLVQVRRDFRLIFEEY